MTVNRRSANHRCEVGKWGGCVKAGIFDFFYFWKVGSGGVKYLRPVLLERMNPPGHRPPLSKWRWGVGHWLAAYRQRQRPSPQRRAAKLKFLLKGTGEPEGLDSIPNR